MPAGTSVDPAWARAEQGGGTTLGPGCHHGDVQPPSPDYGQPLHMGPSQQREPSQLSGKGEWETASKGVMFSSQNGLLTYKDKGFYDKIVPSFSEWHKDGDESSPLDAPSPKESGKLGSKELEVGPAGEPGLPASSPRAPAV